MQNRRQILRAAGALAPAVILPASFTASAQTTTELSDRSTQQLHTTAALSWLRNNYPTYIKYENQNLLNDPTGAVFGTRYNPYGFASIKGEKWELTRLNTAIWSDTVTIRYKAVQKLYFVGDTVITNTFENIRNVLHLGTANVTDARLPDGREMDYPRGEGASDYISVNTRNMVYPVTQCVATTTNRCVQEGMRARMFGLVVPLICYTIPHTMRQTPGTNVVSTSGLLSSFFGSKTFDALDTITGITSRYEMWYAFDRFIGKWRWMVLNIMTDPGITIHSTNAAVMGNARGSIARLMAVPIVVSVAGATIITRAIQAIGQFMYAEDRTSSEDAWNSITTGVALVALGATYVAVTSDLQNMREKMDTISNKIKAYSDRAAYSGIVTASQGNYLVDGLQAQPRGAYLPLPMNADDQRLIEAIENYV